VTVQLSALTRRLTDTESGKKPVQLMTGLGVRKSPEKLLKYISEQP
jgi:hypothetical protein